MTLAHPRVNNFGFSSDTLLLPPASWFQAELDKRASDLRDGVDKLSESQQEEDTPEDGGNKLTVSARWL